MSTHDDFRPDDHVCVFSQGIYDLAYRCVICDRLPRTDEKFKRAVEVVNALQAKLDAVKKAWGTLKKAQPHVCKGDYGKLCCRRCIDEKALDKLIGGDE